MPLDPPLLIPLGEALLIGRDHELAELCGQLTSGARWLTLIGPPGVGKTRLALSVADALGATFEDGVILIELAPLVTPELVMLTVAQQLGVQEDGALVFAAVVKVIQQARMLLVLDNFEHVSSAATEIEALLTLCPKLTVLATSRIPLCTQGEHRFAVEPLAVPQSSPSLDLIAVEAAPATQLFLSRARMARPGFELDQDNWSSVANLVAQLDGLPLALELAAARMRVLPPDALLEWLEQAPLSLGQNATTSYGHHRTLEAAIEWSYALLPPAEQLLFARLGVFAGGFTVEAAASVAVTAALGVDALEGLEGLVDKGLVRLDSSYGRFTLLEVMRRFALSRLGSEMKTQARHAQWIVDLARRAEPALQGESQTLWLGRLEAERNNIRAALWWCTQHSPPQGLEILLLTHRFWLMRSAREGQDWHERFLAQGEDALSADLLVRVFNAAGALAHQRGQLIIARRYYEHGLAHSTAAGDHPWHFALLNNLGGLYYLEGDYQQAETHFQQALDLARAIDSPFVRSAQLNLVLVQQARGKYAAVQPALKECLRQARRSGNDAQVANVLNALGENALAQGDLLAAESYLNESLASYRQAGNPTMSDPLTHLASLETVRGQLAQGMAYVQEALDIRRQAGHETGLSPALSVLGELARQQGNLPRAAEVLREALREALEARHPREVLRALWGLALTLEGAGRVEVSAQLLGATEACLNRSGISRGPMEQAEYDRLITRLRSTLGLERARQMMQVGQALSEDELLSLGGHWPSADARKSRGVLLTVREQQVLRLIASGQTNKDVARALGISERTAKFHLTGVMNKLGVNSRAHAVAEAAQQGLLSDALGAR
ncbi:tetratricopeptide repeat protein [Deinococcus oregonensis]|uniref:Tetratricopeptide repeat protein n=1 Tax=Deinococcus oregonensis TaxID=1805970 RepID=A0ABV6ASK9_9DEIO